MKIDLPGPPPGPLSGYLTSLVSRLRDYLSQMVDENTAINGIMLRAPNGKIYRLTVSNTGVLTATYVQG